MYIELTERALEKVLQTAEQEGIDVEAAALRVAVVPGGCSGLTYDLGWDTTITEEDVTEEIGGVTVVLDKRSRLYVDGAKLDFTSGLEGQGFHFQNPQAERTCACGESFGM